VGFAAPDLWQGWRGVDLSRRSPTGPLHLSVRRGRRLDTGSEQPRARRRWQWRHELRPRERPMIPARHR
jgi:hypothetical protein